MTFSLPFHCSHMAKNSHVFLLLSCLLRLFSAVSAAVFLSYDCGSSDLIYTDGNGIIWTGDDTIMQNNGIPQTVQPGNSISPVMDTLRVFTNQRKKNCYTINLAAVDGGSGAGQQILVRASFYYGNYDNKSSPPSFDLQFEGNAWATVRTFVDRIVYYEIIYVATKDYTSVCVARTSPEQFPFISALEIRSLGSMMYGDISADYALFLKRRVGFGTNDTVRYPDDIYDRIWNPIPDENGLIPVSSEALFIDNNGGDNPPEQVLKNAITTSNTSEFIQLSINDVGFPPFEVPVYMTMYFSEVTSLSTNQERSFTLYIGNESFSSIISPPYENFTELFMSNISVSSNTIFKLMATPDSTLPPLINAMEVFFISDPLTKGTNTKDMDGISSLQSDFETIQDWGGDPCLPSPYSWDWLNCTDDSIPRITALYLRSFDLSGSLPDFSSMDNLEIIDMSNNSLTGQIPEFLGTFPNLKQLDLSDNLFSGSIPTSLSNKNGLKLVVRGNPDLCTSASDNSCQTTSSSNRPISGDSNDNNSRKKKKKKSKKVPIILGTSIPGFTLIWAVLGIFAILHYNKRKAEASAAIVASNPGESGGGGNMSPMPLLNNNQMMGNVVGEVAMNNVLPTNPQTT